MAAQNIKRSLQLLWERALEDAMEKPVREQEIDSVQLKDAAGITSIQVRSDLRAGVGSIWGTCGVNCTTEC